MAQDEEPLTIYVSGDTKKRLEAIAEEIGREPWDLALSSIEEAALDYYRARGFRGDPARTTTEGKTHV